MFLGWKERYCSLAVETIPPVGPARRERGRILHSAALVISCMAGRPPKDTLHKVPADKRRSGGQGALALTEEGQLRLLPRTSPGSEVGWPLRRHPQHHPAPGTRQLTQSPQRHPQQSISHRASPVLTQGGAKSTALSGTARQCMAGRGAAA